MKKINNMATKTNVLNTPTIKIKIKNKKSNGLYDINLTHEEQCDIISTYLIENEYVDKFVDKDGYKTINDVYHELTRDIYQICKYVHEKLINLNLYYDEKNILTFAYGTKEFKSGIRKLIPPHCRQQVYLSMPEIMTIYKILTYDSYVLHGLICNIGYYFPNNDAFIEIDSDASDNDTFIEEEHIPESVIDCEIFLENVINNYLLKQNKKYKCSKKVIKSLIPVKEVCNIIMNYLQLTY